MSQSGRPSDSPRGEVYDLGVIELDTQTTQSKSFTMPFDGWISRVGSSWPKGSNNAVGFNLQAELPDIASEEITTNLRRYVQNTEYFFPSNHPNPEYVSDDDAYIPFYPYKWVPEGVKVTCNVRNESTGSPLDLQVRVSVTDFDPRNISSSGGGR